MVGLQVARLEHAPKMVSAIDHGKQPYGAVWDRVGVHVDPGSLLVPWLAAGPADGPASPARPDAPDWLCQPAQLRVPQLNPELPGDRCKLAMGAAAYGQVVLAGVVQGVPRHPCEENVRAMVGRNGRSLHTDWR
jgi:hypothetical protein